MKKIITLLLASVLVCSCRYVDDNEEKDETLSKATSRDSSVVNDKDENGCLASAGYVWSKVNKECVKGFSGIQLNPMDKPNNEDETLSAYVMFNEDGDMAEVFLPKDTASIVLKRPADRQPWTLDDWQLIPSNGYILKKADKAMFAGDGEMGKKITDSDTEQQ